MKLLNWKYLDRKKGYFYLNLNKIGANIIEYFSGEKIQISPSEGRKIYSKLLKKYLNNIKFRLLIRDWNISRWKNKIIIDIYRIEILDKNGYVIDAINTHHNGVPKEIRKEFNKSFRNDDGSDRIISLEKED